MWGEAPARKRDLSYAIALLGARRATPFRADEAFSAGHGAHMLPGPIRVRNAQEHLAQFDRGREVEGQRRRAAVKGPPPFGKAAASSRSIESPRRKGSWGKAVAIYLKPRAGS
jgi:hypothetical protein